MDGLQNDRAKEVEDDAETERVIGLVMKVIEDDLRGSGQGRHLQTRRRVAWAWRV